MTILGHLQNLSLALPSQGAKEFVLIYGVFFMTSQVEEGCTYASGIFKRGKEVYEENRSPQIK